MLALPYEIWKPIKGSEKTHMVSSQSRVKSIYKGRDRILNPNKDENGYWRCGLGNKRRVKLHRIVAEAFIPNPLNKPTVNHKNLNKSDCRLNNLEWATMMEQVHHAWNNGACKPYLLGKKSSLHYNSVKINQYDLDGNFIKTWNCMSDIYRKMKINHGRISGCCLGKYGYKTAGGYIWKYKDGGKKMYQC